MFKHIWPTFALWRMVVDLSAIGLTSVIDSSSGVFLFGLLKFTFNVLDCNDHNFFSYFTFPLPLFQKRLYTIMFASDSADLGRERF